MDGKGKKLVYASCTVIVETMLNRYQVNDTKQERSWPTLIQKHIRGYGARLIIELYFAQRTENLTTQTHKNPVQSSIVSVQP
jgi:hypothetical protein